jgi:DNA-directed RNA polymerase specialized sigma24 family protein
MAVQRVSQHAPFLRRYARALTGSQTEGDAYVQSTLEALLGGSLKLGTDLPPRVALFRAFHAVWPGKVNGKSLNHGHAAVVADERLQTLAPHRRAALLLTLMEGFSVSDAAIILDISAEEVEQRIAAALAEIDRELATEVLIIEDEPIIALDLQRLVDDLGHHVIGVAATRSEAVEMARDANPGLVLADIQLADGSSGIDTAQDILQDHDVPVIFITAFPERLLTGGKPEPAYLVTKPFDDEAVKAVIGQALFFHDPRRAARAG